MTKKTDLDAARAALRELDQALIDELVADIKALQEKGAAATAETPLGAQAKAFIASHTAALLQQFVPAKS